MMNKLAHVNEAWTLFLDRDGVINERIQNGYVLKKSQFHFKKGVLEGAASLFAKFGRVIIVTNQQCVALGLISEDELNDIHQHMSELFSVNGAKIDLILAATELKNEFAWMRKPNLKMGEMAKQQFPSIDFSKSIMVGDTDGDLIFGNQLGMKTVLIHSDETIKEHHDLTINDLDELIHWI